MAKHARGDTPSDIMASESEAFDVMDEVDPEAAASLLNEVAREDEEVDGDDEGGSSDPIALYLREIRSISLLSRDEEIELTKQRDQGRRSVLEAVFSAPMGSKRLSSLAERSRLEISQAVRSWHYRKLSPMVTSRNLI